MSDDEPPDRIPEEGVVESQFKTGAEDAIHVTSQWSAPSLLLVDRSKAILPVPSLNGQYPIKPGSLPVSS